MEELDFLNYKIGDKDINGETITNIYCVSEKYFLYEIKKNGLVNKLYKEELCNATNLCEIECLLAQFNTYLTNTRRLKNNAQIVANAMAYSLDNNVKFAIQYLQDHIAIKEKERQIKNRLSYLLACLMTVLSIAIITLAINLVDFKNEKLFYSRFLFTIAAFGSFGGFISVFFKVNRLEVEVFPNFYIQIFIGISRIFLAMISSLVVYALIKSNIVFGFIKDIDNKYVFYAMASLSGFSEYFIPNILTSLGNKKEGKTRE